MDERRAHSVKTQVSRLDAEQGRTIVPQSFSVKQQRWRVPKKIGVAKQRESRTLGEAVGAELTRLRIARGWSQQKLADQLAYTERYIGQLERGTKSPTLRTITDIAEVFSTAPSVILRAAERRYRSARNGA